jgi:hypothetical protein
MQSALTVSPSPRVKVSNALESSDLFMESDTEPALHPARLKVRFRVLILSERLLNNKKKE